MLYKTKSQLRVETKDAVEAFIRKGGVVEICKPSKKGMKAGKTMKSSTTRSTVVGGGKPMGFTRSRFG